MLPSLFSPVDLIQGDEALGDYSMPDQRTKLLWIELDKHAIWIYHAVPAQATVNVAASFATVDDLCSRAIHSQHVTVHPICQA